MGRVTLRQASASDADKILAWRNDPGTREFSLRAEPISRSEHAQWLAATLSNPDVWLLVAVEDGRHDVGVVRFDRRTRGEYEIHVNVAPEARGRGLGTEIIQSGCALLGRQRGFTRVVARIRPGNVASLRAFACAGFAEIATEEGLRVLGLERRAPVSAEDAPPPLVSLRAPLVLINLRSPDGAQLSALAERLPAGSALIFLSRCLPPGATRLAADRFRARLMLDLLPPEDCAHIDDFVLDFTRGWYREAEEGSPEPGDDDLEFFLCAIEYDLQFLLFSRLRNLELADRAIERFRPDGVLTLEDTGELHGPAALAAEAHFISAYPLTAGGIAPAPRKSPPGRALLARLRKRRDLALARLALRRLLDARAFDSVILASQHFARRLRAHRSLKRCATIPYFFGRGFSTKVRRLAAGRAYFPAASGRAPAPGELERRWQRLMQRYRPEERFRYGAFRVWSLVEAQLRDAFFGSFSELVSCRESFRALRSRKQVAVVLLPNDVLPQEKAMVLAAREAGIPSLHVQHGVLAGKHGWDQIHSDFVAVWGPQSIRWFEALGNSPSRCIVTGNPGYDDLYRFRNRKQEASRAVREKLAPRGSLLTLAFSYVKKLSALRTDDEMDLLLDAVLRAMEALPEVRLVVKLHPRDRDASRHRRVVARSGLANVTVSQDIHLWTLILASDALLTMDSTAGLEAMILGRPVVVVNLTGRPDWVPYVQRGAALGVYRQEDLPGAIRGVLSDRNLQETLRTRQGAFVRDFAFRVDGGSFERLDALICELARSGPARLPHGANGGRHLRVQGLT